jgi:hypothetical protein
MRGLTASGILQGRAQEVSVRLDCRSSMGADDVPLLEVREWPALAMVRALFCKAPSGQGDALGVIPDWH